jgi:N-methylhydantoinase A
MIEEFHRRHYQLYGFSLDQPVEIVTLRVTASGHLGDVAMPTLPTAGGEPADAVVDRRQVYFEELRDFAPCPIYRRERLCPEATIAGPAILEAMDSTVVINPGWETRIDRYGNCIMRAEENGR